MKIYSTTGLKFSARFFHARDGLGQLHEMIQLKVSNGQMYAATKMFYGCKIWSILYEFRALKKEFIKQMKEYQRQADIPYEEKFKNLIGINGC